MEVTLLDGEGWQSRIVPARMHRSHPPFLLAPGYFQLYEATVAQCANGR